MNFIVYFIRRAKLTYPKILRNFRKMVYLSVSKFLLDCDYLIVILLLPGDVFLFLIRSKYSDLLTSVLQVE